MVILFLSIPVLSIIAFIIGGDVLTPFLLYIHKKVLGRKLIYGIQERKRPEKFKGAFIKSLFPAMLAFNIGILLMDETWIHDLIFHISFQVADVIYKEILTLTLLFPIICAIGICAFSAAFFLIDAGIEYTNKGKRKVKRGSFPIDVRSVGGYYLYYLKGYAGISVILSIIDLIIRYFGALSGAGVVFQIINIITWPFMPFILALFMVPVFIIQDISHDRWQKYTLKWADKMDIMGELEDPLGKDQR